MKNIAAQQLGKLGGIARAKKYDRKALSDMGKKGGRPRKTGSSKSISVSNQSTPQKEREEK